MKVKISDKTQVIISVVASIAMILAIIFAFNEVETEQFVTAMVAIATGVFALYKLLKPKKKVKETK